MIAAAHTAEADSRNRSVVPKAPSSHPAVPLQVAQKTRARGKPVVGEQRRQAFSMKGSRAAWSGPTSAE
jgi:hypothetical protein